MERRHLILVLAVITGIAASRGGHSQADRLDVTELRLVDGQGRPRARLTMDVDLPRFELLDSRGRTRLALGLLEEEAGAEVVILDTSGDMPRVLLRAEDPRDHGSYECLVLRPGGGVGEDSPSVGIDRGGNSGEGATLWLDSGAASISMDTHSLGVASPAMRLACDGGQDVPPFLASVGPVGPAEDRSVALVLSSGQSAATVRVGASDGEARLRVGEQDRGVTLPR